MPLFQERTRSTPSLCLAGFQSFLWCSCHLKSKLLGARLGQKGPRLQEVRGTTHSSSCETSRQNAPVSAPLKSAILLAELPGFFLAQQFVKRTAIAKSTVLELELVPHARNCKNRRSNSGMLLFAAALVITGWSVEACLESGELAGEHQW